MTDLSISVTRLGLSLHSHKDFATRGGEIALPNLSSPHPPTPPRFQIQHATTSQLQMSSVLHIIDSFSSQTKTPV